MIDSRRLLLIGLLLFSLFMMMVHYGAVRQDHFPYTSTDELRSDYRSHIGESTYFWAEVTHIEKARFKVDNYAIDLWVSAPAEDIDIGDTVQVYGTVLAERTIDAKQIYVSPRPNRMFMFGVSSVAAALVVISVLRYWWFDRSDFVFQKRRDSND